MDYRRIVILAVAFLLNNLLLSATDIDVFYQKAITKFDSIKTLQADISQTNEFIQTKTKLQSTGKLFYKPGNLLMDYSKPNIQKLIIKGNSVIIYDKSSKTLVKSTNSVGISNPLQIVEKYWSTSSRELIAEDSVSIKIRLLPVKDEYLKKLEVTFNQSSLMITELSYWDKSGNKVRFRFLNIRTGITIPAAKWKFVPPPGVKVIQQ